MKKKVFRERYSEEKKVETENKFTVEDVKEKPKKRGRKKNVKSDK